MTTRGPALLFVDGIDGSGKSTLASALHDHLQTIGVKTALLHVDDFRKPIDWQAAGARQAEAYYNDYFDLLTLDLVLEALTGGKPNVRVPQFRQGESPSWSVMEASGVALVIIEGVFTQRLPMATQGALLYVDASWATTRDRILLRDQAKGRSFAEVTMRIDERYFPGQSRYETQCGPRKKAHWLATPDLVPGRPGFRVQRTKVALPWPNDLAADVTKALCQLFTVNANDRSHS